MAILEGFLGRLLDRFPELESYFELDAGEQEAVKGQAKDWCSEVANMPVGRPGTPDPDANHVERNRAIQQLHGGPARAELERLCAMLCAGYDLLGQEGDPDASVASLVPFQEGALLGGGGLREQISMAKMRIRSILTDPACVWGPAMLFEDWSRGQRPSVLREDLSPTEDPFARYLIDYFCKLWDRLREALDEAVDTALRQSFLTQEKLTAWEDGVRELDRMLLGDRAAVQAAPWVWMGLNRIAHLERARVHDVRGLWRTQTRRAIGSAADSAWVPFAALVYEAAELWVAQLVSSIPSNWAGPGQIHENDDHEEPQGEVQSPQDYWSEWKLGWFDDQLKLSKQDALLRERITTARLTGLSDFEMRVLGGIYDHIYFHDSRLLSHEDIGEARSHANGVPWGGIVNSWCRRANTTLICKLNRKLRNAINDARSPRPIDFDEAERKYVIHFGIQPPS